MLERQPANRVALPPVNRASVLNAPRCLCATVIYRSLRMQSGVWKRKKRKGGGSKARVRQQKKKKKEERNVNS